MTPQVDSVLDLFRATGAYLEGHFRLTSGLHSPNYLQCALVLRHPAAAEDLGVQHFRRALVALHHLDGAADAFDVEGVALFQQEHELFEQPRPIVREQTGKRDRFFGERCQRRTLCGALVAFDLERAAEPAHYRVREGRTTRQ